MITQQFSLFFCLFLCSPPFHPHILPPTHIHPPTPPFPLYSFLPGFPTDTETQISRHTDITHRQLRCYGYNYKHTYIHTHLPPPPNTHIHTHTHAYTHTHTHTHTHTTHTHTHTHTLDIQTLHMFTNMMIIPQLAQVYREPAKWIWPTDGECHKAEIRRYAEVTEVR